MDSQQSRGWHLFEQRAYEILRHGYREARKVNRLVHVLILPSFEPAIGWEVFKTKSAPSDYLAAQMRWRRDKDFDRFMVTFRQGTASNPMSPTLETHTVRLQPTLVEQMLAKLAGVQIPVWIEDTELGLYGVSYEVVFGNCFHSTRYKWWNDPPDEWKPLTAAIEELLATLDSRVG